MIKEDEEKLLDLIGNYSVSDILDALNKNYLAKADIMSDMSYKKEAAWLAKVADKLDEVRNFVDNYTNL